MEPVQVGLYISGGVGRGDGVSRRGGRHGIVSGGDRWLRLGGRPRSIGRSHMNKKPPVHVYLDLPSVQHVCLTWLGFVDEKAERLHSWKIQV